MAAIVNSRDLYLQSSTRKIDIRNPLDSTSTLVKMDSVGVVTPNSFTLSTVLYDSTYTSASFPSNCLREWFYRPNNSTSWIPISTSTTTNYIVVTNTQYISHLGSGASAVEYKVVLSSPGYTTSTQTILVYYQQEVSNTVMLQLNSYVGIVSATSAGVVNGSFPTATARMYNGNTQLTSGISYNVEGSPSATKNNLTVAINSSGTITVSGASWSTDSESFTINGVYNTATYVAVYTVTKAKAGASGNSLYTATIYQQSASVPATPTGGTYNFLTSTLTAPSGWTGNQPATTTTPTYACDYTFSGSPLATVTAGTWSTPYIEAVNGSNGTNGEYRDIIELYLQSGSTPTAPTSATYTFSTNTISGVSGGTAGWSMTQPASSTTPTYVIKTLASTTTPGTGISLPMAGNSWSTPVIVAQNGAQGPQGPQGPSGSNGSQGTRGNLTVNLNGGWSDSTANSLIYSAAISQGSTPTSPINGDIAYYTGGAKVYNYGWSAVSSFIDGSLVVTGTLGADKISAGTISANVSLNSGGYVRAYGSIGTYLPYPFNSTLQVVGNFSGNAIGVYGEGTSAGVVGSIPNGNAGTAVVGNGGNSGTGGSFTGSPAVYGNSNGGTAFYANDKGATCWAGLGVGTYFTYPLHFGTPPSGSGSSNAYYSTLKPGTSNVYNEWVLIRLQNTDYYFPVWRA